MSVARILGVARTSPAEVFFTVDPARYSKVLIAQGSPVAKAPEELEQWVQMGRELNDGRPVLVVLSGRAEWVRGYLDSCPSVPTWIICVVEEILAALDLRPIDADWDGGKQIDLDEVLNPSGGPNF